jgi:hypothetical protein
MKAQEKRNPPRHHPTRCAEADYAHEASAGPLHMSEGDGKTTADDDLCKTRLSAGTATSDP